MTSYSLNLGPVALNVTLTRDQLGLGIDLMRNRRSHSPRHPARPTATARNNDGPQAIVSAVPDGLALEPILDTALAAGCKSKKRILDLSPGNGRWARALAARFEAVTAVTVEWPRGDGSPAPSFDRRADSSPSSAQDVTRSGGRIETTRLSIADLTPARLGLFDLAVCAGGLTMARCPVRLLQRLATLVDPNDGTALLIQVHQPALDRFSTRTIASYRGQAHDRHWSFGLRTLERMARDAGFDRVTILADLPLDGISNGSGAERIVAMRLGHGA